MTTHPFLPFLLVLLFAGLANAQDKSTRHQRWETGLQAGLIQSQNDLSDRGFDDIQPGGGLLLRYHIDDIIALRAQAFYGEISGDDANIDKQARGFRFSAPIGEAALMAELDFLGKRRWDEKGQFKKTLSPYIFGGVGYALSQPSTFYNETLTNADLDLVQRDKNQQQQGVPILPFGAGVKLDLNKNWVIAAETGLRVTFNDYLDGVSYSANPLKNDTYATLNLSVTYRFDYTADRDRDGVEDGSDACPDEKGSAETNGCPDTDGDGIPNKMDSCPDEKGSRFTNGCPDTDGDGIPDKSDACPEQKGPVGLAGCPDTDGDGILDAKDRCPQIPGIASLEGCPDTDGDGITDASDACPNLAGPASNNGCPVNDRDRDGIPDESDKCPDQAGTAAFAGCPDTDGDQVGDFDDKCPTIPGVASNAGCPIVAESDQKILAEALYGVQFESGKSVIKPASYAILDQVVAVMERNAAYQMTISGHTDSAGSAASNQKLSEARAKACYDYLLSKGVAAARMRHQGFGESQPIADNATAAGKAKNRRVAFELLLQP